MLYPVTDKQTLVFLQCLSCEALTFSLQRHACQHCGSGDLLPTIWGQRNPLLIPATACARRPQLRAVKHSLGNWYVQEGDMYLGWIRGGGRRWLATTPSSSNRKPFQSAQDALDFLLNSQAENSIPEELPAVSG